MLWLILSISSLFLVMFLVAELLAGMWSSLATKSGYPLSVMPASRWMRRAAYLRFTATIALAMSGAILLWELVIIGGTYAH